MLLLRASFNLSMDHTFSIMKTLTGSCNVKADWFRKILHNLKGYECSTRGNDRTDSQWDDQRSLLHNMHPLEQKSLRKQFTSFLIVILVVLSMMMSF
jgi:hypothetical protein